MADILVGRLEVAFLPLRIHWGDGQRLRLCRNSSP